MRRQYATNYHDNRQKRIILYHSHDQKSERILRENFTTIKTDLHHKSAAIFEFRYAKNGLVCNLPNGEQIIAQKKEIFGTIVWEARIVDSKNLPVTFGAAKNPLIATGDNWARAVARLLGIRRFFHKKSFSWLSYHDLCKPHLVHPKSKNTNKLPRNIGDIPTSA